MDLGKNIYQLRTEHNMSQGDLANALEVSRQSVSKWENNSATPELEKLLRMSELFGVTLDRLAGRDIPTSPAETPQPPEAASRTGMPVHRILGIILLCFGLAAFLILTVLSGMLAGFLCSAPLITVGIICTVCTDELPFRCWWTIFAVYTPVICLVTLGAAARLAFVLLTSLLMWFVILLIWTIAGIRKGKIGPGAKKMAMGCMAFALVIALVVGIAFSPLIRKRTSNHSTEFTIEAIPVAAE